jgi:hypothetical protein
MPFEAAAVFARLGANVDRKGFEEFDAAVKTADGKKAQAALGADFNPRAFDAYHKAIVDSKAASDRRSKLKTELGGNFDPRAFRAYERALKDEAKQQAAGAQSTRQFGDAHKGANIHIGAMASSLGKLYKQAGAITALGIAAQAVSALSGAAAGALGTLAPLSGALVAYPAIAGAAAQGLGVFKLATSEILPQVGGLNTTLDESTKKFKALSPEAKKFARELEDLKKPMRELPAIAQKGLLPGLSSGITDASKNLPIVKRLIGDTAKEIGGLATQAGKLVGSKGFGADLQLQGERNVKWIGLGGDAALHFADALRHVVVAGGPLTNWIVHGIDDFAKFTDAQAKAGRESGKLGKFFEQTRIEMSRVVRIGADVAVALYNIVRQGKPLGDDLLVSLVKNADAFRRWTESAKGQNVIAEYFRKAKAPAYEMFKLLRDLSQLFFRVGNGDQVGPLLQVVRRELVPAFEKLVTSTTQAFGPAFIHALTQALLLFSKFAGSSGPLVIFAKMIGSILENLNKLLDTFPGLNTALVALAAAGGLVKALQLTAAITGMGRLLGLIKTAKTVGIVSALTGGGAAAGGGGLLSKIGGGASAARGMTPATPLYVAVIGGIGGGVPIAGGAKGAAIGTGAAAAGGGLASRIAPSLTRSGAGIAAVGGAVVLSQALRGPSGPDVGLLNKYADTLNKVVKTSNSAGMRALAAQLRETAHANADLTKGENLKRFADALDKTASTGGKDVGALQDAFARLPKSIGGNIESVRRSIGALNRTSLDDLSSALSQSRKNFDTWAAAGSNNLKGVRTATSENMHFISRTFKTSAIDLGDSMKEMRDKMRSGSADGREALAKNFRLARSAIRQSMNDGKISVKDGLAEIQHLMRAELAQYGVTGKTASAIIKHGDIKNDRAAAEGTGGGQRGGRIEDIRAGKRGFAAGGWLGGKGMVSDDIVPIGHGAMAAFGEYFAKGPGGQAAVLNRHQAPIANIMLAAGGWGSLDSIPGENSLPILERAMAPIGGLDTLFSQITRPHMFQKGGRFAGGGIVPVPGFPGESAASSVIPMIERIAKMFGLTLTDAFGSGHKSPGHTKFGTAADFSGSDAAMDAAVKWLVGQGYLVGYDGRYGSKDWPGHGPHAGQGGSNAHLHVELGSGGGGGGGGAIAAAVRKITAPKTGMTGALGSIVQGALNAATFGANKKLQDAAAAAVTVPVGGGGGGGGGANASTVRRWLAAGLRLAGQKATSGNIATLFGRAMQESGGNPRIVNNWDSNAKAGHPSKGLLQTIDSTFKAYMVKGHGDIFNPIDNTAAAVRYMLATYGRLVGSSSTGYQSGGRFAKGGVKNRYLDGISRNEIPAFAQDLWNRETTMMGSPGPLPPISIGYAGKKNYATFNSGTGVVRLSKELVAAFANPKNSSHSYALESIVHEFAHARQRGDVMQDPDYRLREGGAELFAQFATAKLMRDMGIPYNPAGTATYGSERAFVKKSKGDKWWRWNQFSHPNDEAARGGRLAGRFAWGGRSPGSFSGTGKLGKPTLAPGGPKLASSGPQHGFRLTPLRNLNSGRSATYDGLAGAVEAMESEYSVKDRLFNISVEQFINDDGSINPQQIAKRVGELNKLIEIRQNILTFLKAMRRLAETMRKSYKTIIKRLRGAMKHASKKNRTNYASEISTYEESLGKVEGDLSQLKRDQIPNAQIDLIELNREMGSVRDTVADDSFYQTDTSGGDFSDTGGASAPDTSAADGAAATDLQGQVAQLQEALRVSKVSGAINAGGLGVFAGVGEIGSTGRGGTALGSVNGTGVGVSQGVEGGGVVVYQTNQMLMPGSPEVLSQLAGATVQGLGLQPSITAPRVQLGG